MRLRQFVGMVVLLAVAAPGGAQSDGLTVTGSKPTGSIGVQFMTDAAIPEDFGTEYLLNQLSNGAYTFGPNFIIEISYSTLSTSSVSMGLSGSQPNYLLAWRVADTSDINGFGTKLGADVIEISGDGSGYYRNDGTLQLLSTEATRYQIGAKSTTAAAVDLTAEVTVTATRY